MVLLYLHMRQIPHAWEEEGVFSVQCCQVLQVIGAVSFLELAANSGSSRMSQAPNVHLVTWLLI